MLHTRLDASFGPVSQSDAPILARLAHDIEFDLGTLGTLQIRRLDLPSRLQRGDLAELAKKPMEDLFIHLPRHTFPLNAVRGPYSFGLGDMTFEQCANLVGGPAQAAIRRSYAELTEKQSEA